MKTKTKYQQFLTYLKSIRNSPEAWRLQNYTLKDSLLKIYLYLYYEDYIRINSLEDFIYILDNSTMCPINTEYIDKNNYNEYYELNEIFKKQCKNNIILLHYADPTTRQIHECDFLIPNDIVKIIKFIDNNINNFEIRGGIWFDSINGNSYNSSIITDIKNNKQYKKPLEYGYGRAYYYDSINYLIENKIIPNIKEIHNYYKVFRDLGCVERLKKKEAKNHLYY